MPLDTWPGSVTQKMQAEGYQEEPQRTVDSFQVDHGSPLENLATSVPSTLISGMILCQTAAEYATLLAFYETTLKQGVKHFTKTHPRLGTATQEFKFESFGLSRVVANSLHYVAVQLRYFPPVT